MCFYYRMEVGFSSMGVFCVGDFYIICEILYDGYCVVNIFGI